jgi:hypothetical protein
LPAIQCQCAESEADVRDFRSVIAARHGQRPAGQPAEALRSDYLLEYTMARKAITLTRILVHDYQWIHLTLGLIGNALFVIGSVYFLWTSTQQLAIWLFIAGSSGMLIGSIGSAIVKLDERRRGPR